MGNKKTKISDRSLTRRRARTISTILFIAGAIAGAFSLAVHDYYKQIGLESPDPLELFSALLGILFCVLAIVTHILINKMEKWKTNTHI